MTKHLVLPYQPSPIATEKAAINGAVPSSSLMRRLALGFNWVASQQKRQILLRSQRIGTVAASGSSDYRFWPFFFRTSENTTGLWVTAGLALIDAPGASSYATIDVEPFAGGANPASLRFNFSGLTATTAVTPSSIHYVYRFISGLTPNTEYYGDAHLVGGARIVSLSIVEATTKHAEDTVTGVTAPGEFLDEGPIYDAQIADLIEANNLLWRHNGAHLFHWAPLSQLITPRYIHHTYWVNPLDNSLSYSATTEGVNLYTSFHNTSTRSSVPVRLAVKAERLSGTGALSIRITDGTNVLEFAGITTGGTGDWYVMSGTIPPQNGTKWDIEGKVSDSTTEFYLHSVCLYEWEADVADVVAAPLPAGEMNLAVITYFYPDSGAVGSKWDATIAEMLPGAPVIINPANGPGAASDANYVSQTATAQAAGLLVIGYVATTYGARPIADVKADIDVYYTWYGVDGIFLDEASNSADPAVVAYYQEIFDYTKTKSARADLVALNPGTTTDEAYAFADIIMVAETDWATYQGRSNPAWEANHPRDKFWHVIHTCAEADMPAAIAAAYANNAGYVYVTDDVMANPYDTIPPYLSAEADEIAAL